MATSAYSAMPLQQPPANYAQYPSPYSLPSTGPTSAEHSIYAETDTNTTKLPHEEPHASATRRESDVKSRLRKACDSCSIRKVRCDEQGPPCKACSALDIPCTFERPSRRRGPPNKHAEAVKKRRFRFPGGSGRSTPTSPTHAAHTLTSFAQHQVLSAESICPFSLLQLLIDDYFTYIHPLIPIPHEPSFREALQRREDLANPTFLALLASMIGCLVASFPRKPRMHLKSQQKENMFPNSMSLVERCHRIAIDARGPGYLDKELSVYDAVISYLQGLTAAYTFQWRLSKLYFGECLTISRHLGLHKSSDHVHSVVNALASPSGITLGGPQAPVDYITQETGRRTFWVMFVAVKSLQALGTSFGDLFVPPPTPTEPYPPLPTEVDDVCIYPTHILPQPPGLISELVGFNANVRVFCSYNSLSVMELAYLVDEVFDWERQKRVLGSCLQTVKAALDDVPQELMLRPGSQSGGFGLSSYWQGLGYRSPTGGFSGTQNPAANYRQDNDESPLSRRRLQCEIQKANIYASQLSTRSYIVEKYWNLRDAYDCIISGRKSVVNSPDNTADGLDCSKRTEHQFDALEQEMYDERKIIVRELLTVLSMISQVNMEPNGLSFINKVRNIASTLLAAPRIQGQLDSGVVECLNAFLQVLVKLDRVGPGSGVNEEGVILGSEEDEEAELRYWADLRNNQVRFAASGGVLNDL
ncbi:hypothetical protein MMC32_007939 [Xylographa parallela]|nr:hypothetical protein [Xylographa parallela]